MRSQLFSLLVAGVCIAAAGNVLAQTSTRVIKCADAKGKVYYTQTPPPECLGRATEEIDRKSGTVVKRSEGQLTPEQLAQREEERKKKLEEDKRSQEEKRKIRERELYHHLYGKSPRKSPRDSNQLELIGMFEVQREQMQAEMDFLHRELKSVSEQLREKENELLHIE